MAYMNRTKRRRRSNARKRRAPETGPPQTTIRVNNQKSLDALADMADANVAVLLSGGTFANPLILRRQFMHPPIVEDGCHVEVVPSDQKHPPKVIILGSGAHVLLRGNARADMHGHSVLRAKDQSKARVYAGRLICGGDSKCALYAKATGIAWGRAKCKTYGYSQIMLMEQAQAVVRHSSTASLWSDRARVWNKSNATVRYRAAQERADGLREYMKERWRDCSDGSNSRTTEIDA